MLSLATLRQPASHAFARVRLQACRWGWPGAVGLGCLVTALTAVTLWLPALQSDSDALEASTDLAERRARRLIAPQPAVAQPLTPAQRFRDAFPSARLRQDRLAALLSVAAEHGLESKRNELGLVVERDVGLDRYTVTMPLAGPYVQLREFIEAAQSGDAALGLDRMRLRRASGGAGVVEADLTWSFYMQTQPIVPALQNAAGATAP